MKARALVIVVALLATAAPSTAKEEVVHVNATLRYGCVPWIDDVETGGNLIDGLDVQAELHCSVVNPLHPDSGEGPASLLRIRYVGANFGTAEEVFTESAIGTPGSSTSGATVSVVRLEDGRIHVDVVEDRAGGWTCGGDGIDPARLVFTCARRDNVLHPTVPGVSRSSTHAAGNGDVCDEQNC